MAARNTDKVNCAAFEHLLSESGVLDVADSDHRDLNSLADIGRQVDLPAFLEVAGLDDGRAGIVSSAADVDAADAESFQIFCLGDAVLFGDAVGQIVAAVYAHRNGEFRAAVSLDAHDDLRNEAHTPLKAAAVFVGALICVGREELADQVAVRGVDLDAVDPGLLGDHSAGDEFADHGLDFLGGHSAGLLADDFAGDVRCRHGLLAADQPAGRLVARMVKLNEDLGVIGMDSFCQARELRDHVCICDAQLVGRADAGLVVDAGDLGDDQACSAFGAVSVVLDHAGAGFAGGLCQGTSHGGHHDAVLELKIANHAGLEKLFV